MCVGTCVRIAHAQYGAYCVRTVRTHNTHSTRTVAHTLCVRTILMCVRTCVRTRYFPVEPLTDSFFILLLSRKFVEKTKSAFVKSRR